MAFIPKPTLMTALLMALCFIIPQQGALVEARGEYRIEDFNVIVPEEINRCRLNCLIKFLGDENQNDIPEHDPCTDRPNCYMCWDYCRILYGEHLLIGRILCDHDTCVSIVSRLYKSQIRFFLIFGNLL